MADFTVKEANKSTVNGNADFRTSFQNFSVEVHSTSEEKAKEAVSRESQHMIAFDGRIDNQKELESELGGDGFKESELILKLYLEEDIEKIEEVRGAFSFIIIGPDELILCRDQTGLRPLYFSKDGEVASNSIERILDERSSSIDASVLSSFLVDEKAETQHTFYENIGRVSPGTYVSISENVKSKRYWNPIKSEYEELSFKEAKEKLREVSVEAVKCRTGEYTGVMMSGGFDSTTVTAIVNESCRTELYTYSGIFPSIEAADETQKINQFVEELEIQNEKIIGDREWPLKDLKKLERSLDTGPAMDINFQLNDKIYSKAAGDGVDVILTGAGGNMLDGSPLMYSDLLKKRKIRRLVADIREDQAPIPLILKWFILLPNLPSPEAVKKFLAKDEETGMPAWFKVSEVDLAGREEDPKISLDSRKVNYKSHFNYYRDSSLEKIRKNARRHGLDVRHPFLDSRVIELALSLPPEHLFKAGKEKHLFRESFKDLLPDAILNQRKTAVFDDLLTKGIFKEEKETVGKLFERPEISNISFVDGGQLRDYLSTRFDEENASLRFWKLLTVEIWLRDDLYKLQ
ncbi:MAG: asparagine synthetase B [Candidatus Nanohaloarchaea archaeon]